MGKYLCIDNKNIVLPNSGNGNFELEIGRIYEGKLSDKEDDDDTNIKISHNGYGYFKKRFLDSKSTELYIKSDRKEFILTLLTSNDEECKELGYKLLNE